MATKKRSHGERELLVNWRVTPAEREHLHKVAASRGTTITALVREGLRNQGALPQ